MRAIVNVSEFFSPAVAGFCKYWIERSGGRNVVPRGEIDVIDMPRAILPNLLLIDLSRDSNDIRYRLVGTRLVYDYGLDFTGMRLSEFEPPCKLEEAIADTYGNAKDLAMPTIGHYGYPTRDGKMVMSEFAVFPISNNDLIDQCIAIEHLDVRSEHLPGDLAPLKRRCI
jgi:hypothetical protein